MGTETIDIRAYQALENSSDEEKTPRQRAMDALLKNPNPKARENSFDHHFAQTRVPFKAHNENLHRHSILTKIGKPQAFVDTGSPQ